VLRPGEVARITELAPRLLAEDYSSVKVFDATKRVTGYEWLPGRGYLEVDRTFTVYRRKQGGDRAHDARAGA
jgi:hypothetical protein